MREAIGCLSRGDLETFALRAAVHLRQSREDARSSQFFVLITGFLLGAVVAASGFLLGAGLG